MNFNNLMGTITGLSIGLIIFVVLFLIAYLVVTIIARWKLFEKNGEKGWKSIVPFYSIYVYTTLAKLNWWYSIILMFGLALSNVSNNNGTQLLGRLLSMFIYFLIFYNLAKKAKKDQVEFGILGALFTPIIEIIMGFSDKYQFDNTLELNPNSIIGEKTNLTNEANQTNNNPDKYCLGCGKKLKPNSKFCENCGKHVE